jgi:peptidoglycan/LPS O-acetylase OafA/YrhL
VLLTETTTGDFPVPVRLGALDGMRALAVAAVVVYHLWPGSLPSGYLGVDLFMVLSGFLITGLLVEERARTGTVRLGAFWARRFRRLVPPLAFMVGVVAIWVHLAGPATLVPTVRGQGLAALAYVSNWKLIHDGVSYAAMSEPASPLLHLWSLGVEEQFYAFWPLLVAGLFVLGRGRVRTLAIVTAVGALASAGLMAVRFVPGTDPLRLYFGTDTRAQSFLVGALACLAARRWPAPRAMQWAGAVAVSIAVVAFTYAGSPDVLYRGGFLLFAIVAAVAIVAATVPGPVTRLLDRPPLRLVGRVSYEIYLWHWPAIVLLTHASTGLGSVGLMAARVAVVAVGTTVSWFLIEQPFRRFPSPVLWRAGPALVGGSVVAVMALSSTSVLAYASVRTDRIPAPKLVVAAPSPQAVASPTVPPATVEALTVAPTTTFLPDRPGTALIIGDSTMYDETPALVAGLVAHGWQAIEDAYPGEGLTTRSIRDSWTETVARYRPDLTIVMAGYWDLDFIAARGDAAYQAIVDDTVSRLTGLGGHVLWLSNLAHGTAPPDTPDRFFSALPERYPSTVRYLDINGALIAPDGTWPRVVNGQLLRKPDGVHLCPDGAAAVAHRVLIRLALDGPSWDTGRWRADRRYNDPPGGCRP